MSKCGRSGKDMIFNCKKKKIEEEETKLVRAELHLEALSESENRAWEKKERCVLYAPQMRAKETRR